MRQFIVAILLSLSLFACSLSQFVARDAVDYNATVEYVNNQQLVLNVLRARDFAPLYFTELGQIHGVISAQVSSQLSSPIGPGKLSAKKFTDVSTISASSSPTFDTSPLDTQQFSQGLLNQPSPQTFKYFSDVSSYLPLTLFLFVSKFKLQDIKKAGDDTEAKKFCGVRPGEYKNDPSDPQAFEAFAAAMATLYNCGLSVESYVIDITQAPPVELTVPADGAPVTFPFPGNAKTAANAKLQQVLDLLTNESKIAVAGGGASGTAGGAISSSEAAKQNAPTQLQYTQQTGGAGKNETLNFRYVKQTDGVAVCTSALSDIAYFHYTDANDTSLAQVCGYGWSREETSAGGGASEESFRLRSAGEMFAYLGALQRYEENRIRSGGTPFYFSDAPCDPLKHPPCKAGPSGQILFLLHSDAISSAETQDGLASDRINVSYLGQTYYVRQGVTNDHTLEALSLLSLMLNLNKNASEISTTRSVDVNLP